MSKLLAVFGATGNQGGSVIRTILEDPVLSKEFKIRGVTRDVKKQSSKDLEAKGVEMVEADMSTPEAAAPAVKGAHTVFVVTNFWESMSAATEIAQGKAVADAAKAAGVQHLIFSSLINTAEASKGRLSHITHFDGKAEIGRYMQGTGIPTTLVLPGLFMTEFLNFIKKNEDDAYLLALPIDGDKGQVPVFLPAADMGKFVKIAIKNYPSYTGKQILAASAYISPNQLMAEWSEVTGKEGKYVQVDAEVFKSFLPPPVAQELLENMLLLENPGYYAGQDLQPSHDLLDEKPTTWKQFVEKNKSHW